MIHLVTYHTPEMSISAERCKAAAAKHGISQVRQWTRAALEQTKFFELNQRLLNESRGSGLWAWKPFIILDTMKRCKPGDVVMYMDAGVELVNNPSYVIDRMQDLWLFGNMYEHRAWCKRQAMDVMKVWPEGKQCQASVIFIKPAAKWFVEEWLKWCCMKDLIDDSPSVAPNYPEFSEHRHDQSLLTNLAYKYGVPLHWWPAMYNNGAFSYPKDGYNDNYPVMFLHHRKRDTEW